MRSSLLLKNLPLVLDPKWCHLPITEVRTMPHMPWQVPAKIEIIRAQAGPTEPPDLSKSRPPVVVSGELEVEVTNGGFHTLASDLELVHVASLERLLRHVVEDLGL